MLLTDIKRLLRNALVVPAISLLFRPFVAGRATVFMLHRFSFPGRSIHGNDPEYLRIVLEYLRREKYNLLSLPEVVQRLENQESVDRSVAFTIDDGYWEQGMVAGPVFAAFDCPVTTFLCTGFLDGKLWFWWDRIEYMFQRVQKREIKLQHGRLDVTYDLQSAQTREKSRLDFTLRLVEMQHSDRLACIQALEQATEIEIPERPPLRYAPMSWDEVRECERYGMTFGPHTVTHPVLSSTDDQCSWEEISVSWRRLTEELSNPVPVFCYPNGRPKDFGEREISTIKQIGLRAAVSGASGHAGPSEFRADGESPFRLRRFALASDLANVKQCVTGVERFKALVRGE